MTLHIHLLGSPRVVLDGAEQPAPRGHKVWGLLAYLVLRETPPGRADVAGLLFPTADDPLAALRWNLSALRRLVGDPGAFRGDPLIPNWSEVPTVDVWGLRERGATPPPGSDLLGTLRFAGCPSFEIWLDAQRRHARGAVESLLHESALALLAAGDAEQSAELAGRLVTLAPYDENYHVLLVRALAVGGHGVDAARRAAACRTLFRNELGVEPGPALDAAMATRTASTTTGPATGRPAVRALLDAGEAAISAGALDPGLECLRRAVADAERLGDGAVAAAAYTALGTALVHAARGSDEEGAAVLHRALACHRAEPASLATAYVELAYVEFLRARYQRVEPWLSCAESVTSDPAQRAFALSVRGSTRSDLGRYADALDALDEAAECAADERRRSYVMSMVGRVHLLRSDLDAAADALDEALERASGSGWVTFVPWPEALRAEVDLRRGELNTARGRLEHAFALGCQIGDPCWEGLSARGLGLVRAAEGDLSGAVETLLDARRRAGRLSDGYVWVEAYALDALATVGAAAGRPETAGWVAELATLAEHSGMAELSVRAALHRRNAGAPGAAEAARALAASVDNPALTALLS
ncbi:AfsR/SARP family transcriptional regulator [Cryptosporangium aurantiacum]|uniref:DNA-binding transcriptional activator of the SARP family n=1 Tax=Cryptosporangium aurantiacum TaxID=134849 RepID=A0A1M7QCH3_9ACTN|nr:BTAD domain-containing putative transcriptional regulator [Cryptosporangium aurantiacum]SHN28488.1 DNA-binding transcriptional activator of the SARP family [Cryptosporangium aurantiacum]